MIKNLSTESLKKDRDKLIELHNFCRDFKKYISAHNLLNKDRAYLSTVRHWTSNMTKQLSYEINNLDYNKNYNSDLFTLEIKIKKK